MLTCERRPYLTHFGTRKVIPPTPPSQSEFETLEDRLEAARAHRAEGQQLGDAVRSFYGVVIREFGTRRLS
jgi:hypothetical protein